MPGSLLDLDQIIRRTGDLKQKWSKDPERQHLVGLLDKLVYRTKQLKADQQSDTNENPRIVFSDDAIEALRLAEQKSKELHQPCLGTEHLLFGLMCSDEANIALLLAATQERFDTFRSKVALLLDNPCTPSKSSGYTRAAMNVIEIASAETLHLHTDTVTGMHLLLGLVQLENDATAQYLQNLGLNTHRIQTILKREQAG